MQINLNINKYNETAFCIGNAESRDGYDLESLRDHGLILGCNGLYRDFSPDLLVSVDKAIEDEIRTNYSGKWVYRHTYDRVFRIGNKEIKDKLYACGSTTAYLAIELGRTQLYFMGHDFNRVDEPQRRNNIYNGTANYKKASDEPCHYQNFISQFQEIINNNPQATFIFVNNNQKDVFNNSCNVEYVTYSEFKGELNDKKFKPKK